MTASGAARILLILFGLGFAALGVRFFLDPAALTADADVAMPNMKAIMEIRTVYGGMFAGLGLAILILGLGRDTLRAGLIALLTILAVVALARVGAVMLGQAPDPLFTTLLAIEIAGAAVAAMLLRNIGRRAN